MAFESTSVVGVMSCCMSSVSFVFSRYICRLIRPGDFCSDLFLISFFFPVRIQGLLQWGFVVLSPACSLLELEWSLIGCSESVVGSDLLSIIGVNRPSDQRGFSPRLESGF